MKNRINPILTFSLLALLFTACSQDDDDTTNAPSNPNPMTNFAIDSDYQFTYELAGNTEAGVMDFTTIESVTGESENSDGFISHHCWLGGFGNYGTDQELLFIYFGGLQLPTNDQPTYQQFLDLFSTGTHDYAADCQGIEIRVEDSNGLIYSTDGLDQSQSDFELLETLQDTILGVPILKTHILFSCEVANVNDPTDILIITNGETICPFQY